MTLRFIDSIEVLHSLPGAQIQTNEGVGNLEETRHEGRSYVQVGTMITQHAVLSWWRVSQVVKSLAATAFALIGVPLLFSSYRHFLVQNWKQSLSGQEVTKLYLLKTALPLNLDNQLQTPPTSSTPSNPEPEQPNQSNTPIDNPDTPEAPPPSFDLDFIDSMLSFDQVNEAFINFLQAHPNSAEAHAKYASFLEVNGNVDLAIEEYRRAIALNPQENAIIERYVRLLDNQNKREEIKQFLQERLSRQPNHLYCLALYFNFLIYIQEWETCDNLCQTIADLMPSKEDIPEYVEFVQDCARHLIKRNKEEDAERIYQKLAASLPNNSQALTYYAEFLTIEGKSDSENLNLDKLNQALALYKRAIEAEDASSDMREAYFELMSDLGKEDEIESSCLAPLEQNPNNVPALANYAYFLRIQGKWEEAAQQYHKLLSLAPQNSEALEAYISVLEQLGDFPKIEQFFEERLQGSPEDENLLNGLICSLNQYAQSLEDQGALEEAAKKYNKLLGLYSHHYSYSYARALDRYIALLEQLGKENEIEQYFDEQLQHDPDDEKILNDFGNFLDRYAQSLEDQGALEEAVKKYTKLLKLYSNHDGYGYDRVLDRHIALLEQLGKENEIEQYFEELLQSNPTDEKILNNFSHFLDRYAQSLKDRGALEEAAKKYTKLLKLYSNHDSYDYEWTLDAYIDLLGHLGKENEIEQYFDEQLKSYPEDKALLNCFTNFLSRQADSLGRRGYLEEAVRLYKKLLALDADYDERPYIQLLKDGNKLDEIDLYYQERLKKDAENERVLFNYADFLDETGQKEPAAEIYKKLLQVAPDQERTIRAYIRLLKELKRENEIEIFCQSGLQTNPNNEELLYAYADLLEEQKRLEEAVRYYKKLLELDLDHYYVSNSYIRILKELDKPAEIEEYYKQRLEKTPENAQVLLNYASFLKENNQSEQAIEIYKKLLQINPKHERAIHGYIELLKKLNRRDEIELFCQAGLQTNPDNEPLLYAYARFLEGQNQLAEATQYYKKLLTLAPNHDYGYALRSYLGVLEKLNQTDEIERIYEEQLQGNLQGNFQKETLLENYARWLEGQNELKKAFEHYQKLLSINPDSTFFQNKCSKLAKILSE